MGPGGARQGCMCVCGGGAILFKLPQCTYSKELGTFALSLLQEPERGWMGLNSHKILVTSFVPYKI